MKVIFLDFDGVIITPESRERSTAAFDLLNTIDRRCLNLLNQLIEATQAKVVISSSWRYFISCEDIDRFLRECDFIGEIIGQTPVSKFTDYNKYRRDEEIKKWLAEHEEIDAYVVLDDQPEILTEVDKYLVRTYYDEGLTTYHIKAAIEILEKF